MPKSGGGGVTALESDWPERAALRVGEALEGRTPWWALHRRGVIASMRTSYKQLPLPLDFEVRVVEVGGSRRRIAMAHGAGRPILVIPGLYARVNEGLFIEVASRIHSRLGRPVTLLEDRFAPGTMELNYENAPSLRALGEELAGVTMWLREALSPEEPAPPAEAYKEGSGHRRADGARLESSPHESRERAGDPACALPEALAFSAGAASLLAAPERTFSRAAMWSAAIEPSAVIAKLRRHPILKAHFAMLHRRCFREARVRYAPTQERLAERLESDRPLLPLHLPLFAVHSEDDPVAPIEPVLSLEPRAGLTVRVIRGGGHLGFGAIAGRDVYLLPFEE